MSGTAFSLTNTFLPLEFIRKLLNGRPFWEASLSPFLKESVLGTSLLDWPQAVYFSYIHNIILYACGLKGVSELIHQPGEKQGRRWATGTRKPSVRPTSGSAQLCFCIGLSQHCWTRSTALDKWAWVWDQKEPILLVFDLLKQHESLVILEHCLACSEWMSFIVVAGFLECTDYYSLSILLHLQWGFTAFYILLCMLPPVFEVFLQSSGIQTAPQENNEASNM